MPNPHNDFSGDVIFDLVGNTPIVQLTRLFKNTKGIKVFAKLEFRNPSGSIKDRIVKYILQDAIACGALKSGGTVIEASSGNTGSSLALFCARLGYKLILTTPSKTSKEKQNYMHMLGASLIVCPAVPYGAPDHYQFQAAQIAKETPGAFQVNQYANPLNIEAHYKTTGPEIWQQMNGKIDWFVTGGSTGGTVTGASKYLKEQNPNIKVLFPDPDGSVFYRYIKTGILDTNDVHSYRVEGVGKDYVPQAMDVRVIDETMQYNDDDAFEMCRRCAQIEGIFPGLSAGGNLAAVEWLIKQLPGPARIVTLIQDSGNNYVSKFM